MTANTRKYTALRNEYGQVEIVPAETAHLPHVKVRWYDGHGVWFGGVAAVLPGETLEAAAERAYGAKVCTKHRDTFVFDAAVLTPA